MKVIYSGKPELAPNLELLLEGEGLNISPDPAPQPGAPLAAALTYEVTMPGDVPPEWQVTMTSIEVAVSKFRELFPDAGGEIDFEGEAADANTPAPNLAWHVAT
jgi:hypothetical protein